MTSKNSRYESCFHQALIFPNNARWKNWRESFKCISWLPNASVLIFFSCFGECCLITSTFSSQSQSKGSRALDVWSVLMEDFTAHWALVSWSLLIREQLSGTLTSCPIKRLGHVHNVAVGARKCHQSDKEKKSTSLLMNFQVLGFLFVHNYLFFMVERKREKHHNCACWYSSALYYVSPVDAETSSIKRCLRSDSMAPQWANCTLMKLIKSQTGAAFSITAVILL